MDTVKNYQPEPIPARKTIDSTRTQITEPAEKAENQSHCEVQFAEITMEVGGAGDGAAMPRPQRIRPASDEKRTLFYEMRKIAYRDMSYIGNPSKVFYCQARMMEDFTDDFESQIPFSCYYPYYQLMGYGQLRTYFTWRTRVRAGDIRATSLSYVFVYIYELLACIGESDPQSSLQRLGNFWKTYRRFDKTIDKYLIQWIRDFHIYYPVKQSFSEFAAEQNLKKFYPRVFIYSSNREDSFELYSDFSKYNIQSSIFFTEETRTLISDCFYFLLCRMRKQCREREKFFEDFIFYPVHKETEWRPFTGALFYPCLNQEDRTVTLSEREVYTCSGSKWTYHAGILTDAGRELIGYIMKEMESALRKKLHFRYKIHANADRCDPVVLQEMEALGIVFPQMISRCVEDFFNLRNRKPVHVDREVIHRIRTEASETQEKLIIPEDEVILDHQAEKVETEPYTVFSEDVWSAFAAALTETETEALRVVLLEENVKAFADAHGIMLEVLLDGINEKAMDTVGDTLLEMDETVTVYEEYKEKLRNVTV
ncbi:hypothetical protein IMSAG013_01005 [Clostridiales bacterium]|nr:hypothetical protein IMSAG013_01005 [Clostridiales bacterium]